MHSIYSEGLDRKQLLSILSNPIQAQLSDAFSRILKFILNRKKLYSTSYDVLRALYEDYSDVTKNESKALLLFWQAKNLDMKYSPKILASSALVLTSIANHEFSEDQSYDPKAVNELRTINDGLEKRWFSLINKVTAVNLYELLERISSMPPLVVVPLPEIIRKALNAGQIGRLLASAEAHETVRVDDLQPSDIVKGVTTTINPKLDKPLKYFDIVSMIGSATPILDQKHKAAAVIALNGSIRLSGNVVIEQGDIAIYRDVTAPITASAPRDVELLRYYHSMN
jgi:hypothetical protein